MDSEKALELVKQGVTLLFLDVPQYTMVAIDTQGIKMIPPSTHFVYYSSSSRDGKEFSPIVGFFIDTGASESIGSLQKKYSIGSFELLSKTARLNC
ncbi:protein AAR2 homolog isoform X2 [Vigna radiata var. radiata]|uniref:Protein AAR2 homolog isoform X2 n=1 Tax=Vigna radiata var. radiata TaxID=3916 RepID=A0A3Q0EPF9_VIGRR|nr:protein AAR2 homolog isoform X2 [Vigna radiata var. radiata]